MTIPVFMFLPPPTSDDSYREVHAYGPSPAGFHTDLAIEIAPEAVASSPALAIVGGQVRCIPDVTSGVATLVLKLSANRALKDQFNRILGISNYLFAYRNITLESIAARLRPVIESSSLAPIPLAERVTAFTQGTFGIHVDAGQELGLPGTVGGTADFNRVGFEITYIPSGLARSPDGWRRIGELLNPSAITRRYDPQSFFASIGVGDSPLVFHTSHRGHPLLRNMTRRVLIELRNEHDQPFVGTANVVIDGGASHLLNFTEASRGTVDLTAVLPTEPRPRSHEYRLQLDSHLFTELPSGGSASENPQKAMSAPQHWPLQAIFMHEAEDSRNWFAPNSHGFDFFSRNNKITYLIDGLATYASIKADLDRIRDSSHYFRLAHWTVDRSLHLLPGNEGSRLDNMCEQVSRNGLIQALVWRNHRGPPPSEFQRQIEAVVAGDEYNLLYPSDSDYVRCAEFVRHLNALPHCAAILDQLGSLEDARQRILDAHLDVSGEDTLFILLLVANSLYPVSAHHQKFVVISGGRGRPREATGAVAYCGGIDFNGSRLTGPLHRDTSKWHDVHAKVEGRAVRDINNTFVERWNNHPDNAERLIPSGVLPPFAERPGNHFVQVTRTYADHVQMPTEYRATFKSLEAIVNAIRHAKSFIYFEDQYFSPIGFSRPHSIVDDLGLVAALESVLSQPAFNYLLILIANDAAVAGETTDIIYQRQVLFSSLRRRYPSKVYVYTRDDVLIHSKVLIIDDVYAKIGSSNVNRRSLTNDSELDIHVIDGAVINGVRRFAHNLRVDLWAEHLNLKDVAKSKLEDPTVALQSWLHPPSGVHVSPYPDVIMEGEFSEVRWSVIDPNGGYRRP